MSEIKKYKKLRTFKFTKQFPPKHLMLPKRGIKPSVHADCTYIYITTCYILTSEKNIGSM